MACPGLAQLAVKYMNGAFGNSRTDRLIVIQSSIITQLITTDYNININMINVILKKFIVTVRYELVARQQQRNKY